MLDQGVTPERSDAEQIRFWKAGAVAAGDFHCADCGYGVTVQVRLPTCPMCAGRAWQRSASSPVSRTAAWPL